MDTIKEKKVKLFTNLGNKKLVVLAYHKIGDINNFKKHLLFFKKKYNLINLKQLNDFFYSKENLPDNPLLITSDDGDISLYEKAFPLLKEQKVPFVIFIITELLNTTNLFWWDLIQYYLGEEKGNKKTWEIKEWPNQKRVEYLSTLGKNGTKPQPFSRQLNTAEVLDMQNAGISICNHSHSHPMFNQCSAEEIHEELEKSKNLLNSLGLESNVFAYPNGNYSIESENLLLEHDIKLAFLFDHKINKGRVHPMRISRLVVNDTTPLWKLKFILSGWHSSLLPLSKMLGKIFR